MSLRAASEHVGIFMVSITDPSLDDVMGQRVWFAELSEPNLLLLEQGDYLLQHGLL